MAIGNHLLWNERTESKETGPDEKHAQEVMRDAARSAGKNHNIGEHDY